MAWIYLAESEDSVWPCMNGSSQLPIVKTTDTHKAYCSQECERGSCQSHLFGTMCARYPVKMFQDRSMLSREAFHARTLVLQVVEQAWMESEAVFSTKLSDLQKKLERRLCFWKTYQQLELEDFQKLSEHLPKWGMIVDGHVLVPKALEPIINAKDGFCLPIHEKMWPTPQARDYRSGDKPGSPRAIRKARQGWSINLNDAVLQDKISNQNGGQLNPTWVEWLMGYQLEWTVLKPWAMQWFRSRRKLHSRDCADSVIKQLNIAGAQEGRGL